MPGAVHVTVMFVYPINSSNLRLSLMPKATQHGVLTSISLPLGPEPLTTRPTSVSTMIGM